MMKLGPQNYRKGGQLYNGSMYGHWGRYIIKEHQHHLQQTSAHPQAQMYLALRPPVYRV